MHTTRSVHSKVVWHCPHCDTEWRGEIEQDEDGVPSARFIPDPFTFCLEHGTYCVECAKRCVSCNSLYCPSCVVTHPDGEVNCRPCAAMLIYQRRGWRRLLFAFAAFVVLTAGILLLCRNNLN